MKTKLLILIVIANLNVCIGQEISPEKSYEDYKRAGNSELIIGSVFVGASLPIFIRLASGEADLDNYPVMIAGGVILMGAGIALLSSSGKKYKRARELLANVIYTPLDLVRMTSKQYSGVPGVSMKLSF